MPEPWAILDKIAVGDVVRFEASLLAHLRNNNKALLDDITSNDRAVKGDLEQDIRAALEEFSKDFA